MLTAESVWQVDLTQVNLQASRLKERRNCNFSGADLRGSIFESCNMVGAKFTRARLEPLLLENSGRLLKTSFSKANLRYSDFGSASCYDTDFSGADLSYANYAGANVYGADFTKANLHEATLKIPAEKDKQ